MNPERAKTGCAILPEKATHRILHADAFCEKHKASMDIKINCEAASGKN